MFMQRADYGYGDTLLNPHFSGGDARCARALSVNEVVVVLVFADPEPDEIVARLQRKGAMAEPTRIGQCLPMRLN
jgi:hypothetical protein